MYQVIVTQKQHLTPRVCLLTLQSATGQRLPGWTAGAHIDVLLPDNMIRQYSLCSVIDCPEYQIAVQLEPDGKGGSRYIHQHVAIGQQLTISEPRNHFPLSQGESPCVFFAAGIGITPFIPMIETCLQTQRPFTLYYAIGEAADNLLSEDYRKLSRLHLHIKAEKGVRLNIAQALCDAPDHSDIFVCGPNGFINDVMDQAAKAGVDAKHIHREFFSAEPIDHSNDGSFEVEIASTGQVINISAQQSILEALEDEGLFIPVSCEEGVCGTCITTLLSGEADHKDVFLTDAEKAQMDKIAVCCSRAKSPRLILDL